MSRGDFVPARQRGLVTAVVVAAAMGGYPATGLDAQMPDLTASPMASDWPAWMTQWSPLAEDGMARTLPSVPVAGSLLATPPGRAGLFWTGGNPAALVVDVVDARSEARAGHTSVDGTFRRPLDPTDAGEWRFGGLAWLPMDRGSVIGRVGLQQSGLASLPHTFLAQPYASNPFVQTDTAVAAFNRTRVLIEGGGGYAFGPLSVGAVLSYRATDGRTERPVIPRSDREAALGGTLGLAWDSGIGGLVLGVHGRATGTSETAAATKAEPPIVFGHLLQGYFEPEPLGPAAAIGLFAARWSRALGGSVGGSLGSGAWAVMAERFEAFEDQKPSALSTQEPNRWASDGWVGRAAVNGPVLGAPGFVQVEWRSMEGEAHRRDLTGAIFRSDESALRVRSELRPELGAAWTGRVSVAVDRRDGLRRDLLQEDRSDIVSWTWAGGLEVAWRPKSWIGIATSLDGARYDPSALLPVLADAGEVVETLVAPEVAAYAVTAHVIGAGVTVRLDRADAFGGWVAVQYARSTPGASDLADAPGGDRSALSVSVGVSTN